MLHILKFNRKEDITTQLKAELQVIKWLCFFCYQSFCLKKEVKLVNMNRKICRFTALVFKKSALNVSSGGFLHHIYMDFDATEKQNRLSNDVYNMVVAYIIIKIFIKNQHFVTHS